MSWQVDLPANSLEGLVSELEMCCLTARSQTQCLPSLDLLVDNLDNGRVAKTVSHLQAVLLQEQPRTKLQALSTRR